MPHTIETFIPQSEQHKLRHVIVSHYGGKELVYRCAITHVAGDDEDDAPELGANEIMSLFMQKIKHQSDEGLSWLPVGIGYSPSEALNDMMEQINACMFYDMKHRAILSYASYYFSKCIAKWGFLTANMYFIFPTVEEITEAADIAALFENIYNEVDSLSQNHRLAVRSLAAREEAEKDKLIEEIFPEEDKVRSVNSYTEQKYHDKSTGVLLEFLVGNARERATQLTYPVVHPAGGSAAFLSGFLVPTRNSAPIPSAYDIECLKILFNACKASTSTLWFPVALEPTPQAAWQAIGKILQHNLLPIEYVRELVWIAANVLESIVKSADFERTKKVFRIPSTVEVLEVKHLFTKEIDYNYEELTQLFMKK